MLLIGIDMDKFTNSQKEIRWGDWYFKNHVIDDDFDYRQHKKEFSEYFSRYGFFVSMMFNDYFSRFTGIQSDRYVSMDLYYFYILPCLNKFEFKNAYTDKNIYTTIFQGVRQPETVLKCMNGLFFDSHGTRLSKADAIGLLNAETSRCIIKPTIDSCNGNGVSAFRNGSAQLQIGEYGNNFIVQRSVRQHHQMSRLNESSVNTIRVFTYRDSGGRITALENMTFLRVGGKGSVKDNGSSGGWLAGVVSIDGAIANSCCKFKNADPVLLQDCLGMDSFVIPGFANVYPFAISLHERMPYFDLLGWDIAIDEQGDPVFIEMNVEPSVEGPQLTQGPAFGCLLDEVMARVSSVESCRKVYEIHHFRDGFDYLLPIG